MRAPPEQTPEPHLLFHSESVLSTFAVGDGKIVGGLYLISAQRKPKRINFVAHEMSKVIGTITANMNFL